jgi:hypothetical protein
MIDFPTRENNGPIQIQQLRQDLEALKAEVATQRLLSSETIQVERVPGVGTLPRVTLPQTESEEPLPVWLP